MHLLRDLCACLALLGLGAAGFSVAFNFGTPRYLVDRLDATLDARLAGFTVESSAAVDRLGLRTTEQIALTRAELSGDMGALAGIADRRIQWLALIADNRLAEVQANANLHGVILEKLLQQELGRAVDSWAEVANEAQATLAESRRTVHDLHPQVLGLVAASKVAAGEVATMGREWQRAAPQFVGLGTRIGANVETVTVSAANIGKNIERLTRPRWYDRIFGYGLNGAVMYRNLHPATNLTIKGAEIISSRP